MIADGVHSDRTRRVAVVMCDDGLSRPARFNVNLDIAYHAEQALPILGRHVVVCLCRATMRSESLTPRSTVDTGAFTHRYTSLGWLIIGMPESKDMKDLVNDGFTV